MKKFNLLPLAATMLLMSCSGGSTGFTSQPQRSSSQPQESSISSKAESKMTSIDLGKMYLDINFANKPEGFKIKVGDQTITETTTISMNSSMTFTVEGKLNNVCFYRAVETSTPTWSAGKSEHVDEEAANNMLGRYLTRVANKLSDARVYFCITDTEGGWSKSIPGVDWIITNYSPVM